MIWRWEGVGNFDADVAADVAALLGVCICVGVVAVARARAVGESGWIGKIALVCACAAVVDEGGWVDVIAFPAAALLDALLDALDADADPDPAPAPSACNGIMGMGTCKIFKSEISC